MPGAMTRTDMARLRAAPDVRTHRHAAVGRMHGRAAGDTGRRERPRAARCAAARERGPGGIRSSSAARSRCPLGRARRTGPGLAIVHRTGDPLVERPGRADQRRRIDPADERQRIDGANWRQRFDRADQRQRSGRWCRVSRCRVGRADRWGCRAFPTGQRADQRRQRSCHGARSGVGDARFGHRIRLGQARRLGLGQRFSLGQRFGLRQRFSFGQRLGLRERFCFG